MARGDIERGRVSRAGKPLNPQTFCELAGRLMKHPAAPYFEADVRQEVERICAENQLPVSVDAFGNVLIRLAKGGRQRPIVLAAHMDHPGFEIVRPLAPGRFLARFRGGVPDEYFLAGTALRLMPGRAAARLGVRKGKQRLFEIQTRERLATSPRFAVWELEDFAVRQGRIYGRACDDLIGVAAILATMAALQRAGAAVNVIAAVSRAEEVGFHGALALGGTPALPKSSLVISLETSRELPGAKMGQGMVIRVGDRASVFSSEATRFLSEVARELGTAKRPFPFQRALMSGGTCEGTAYQELGFQTAAVCVALGNYHNCAEANRIETEFVSVADACGMVEFLVAVARRIGDYRDLVDTLPARLRRMAREARTALRKTRR